MSKSLFDRIEISPGTCGNKPRIAGTRIRVQDIAALTEMGQFPDEITAAYPHLTLDDIHAALVYYHDHRDDIEKQMDEDEKLVSEFIKTHKHICVTLTDEQQ
jgi:uncharacterized protein (DUF433 family)